MIVIFEGADGVGKSTAAKILYDELRKTKESVRRLHRGVPRRDPLLEYTCDLEDYSPQMNGWAICDRWHWGELIYGPLYRGKSVLSTHGHLAVDEFLARRGALILHMDGDKDEIVERVKRRGDDYVDVTHLPFIMDEYRRIRELQSPVHRRTIIGFSEVTARVVINEALAIMKGLHGH